MSATPTASHNLPFRLLNAIPHALSSDSFTLIGITHSWGVMIFGDHVDSSSEEGSHPHELAPHAVSGRKSLFQDIFGKSAFVDISAAPTISATIIAERQRAEKMSQHFDAPSHLMPPLETLFDSVMTGILASRSTIEEEIDVEARSEVLHDEDIDMDVGHDGGLISLSAPLERVTDNVEITALVELFQRFAVKG